MTALPTVQGIVPAAGGGINAKEGPRQHAPTAFFPGTGPDGCTCAGCEHFKPTYEANLERGVALRRAAKERTLAALENRRPDPSLVEVPPFEAGRCAEAIRVRRSDRRAPPWDGGRTFDEKENRQVELTAEEWRKRFPDWWRTIAVYPGRTAACREYRKRGAEERQQ